MATMWQVYSSHGVEEDAGLRDLSRQDERQRLSQAAIDGFFAIMDKWNIPMDTAADLLGGVPRSSFYKLRNAAGTLKQDELMRVSCIVGIYKALHSLLPAEFADQWMSCPNDHPLFAGRTPAEYAVRAGIPGLLQIRNMLDAETSGH